jgi:hypothetical protein
MNTIPFNSFESICGTHWETVGVTSLKSMVAVRISCCVKLDLDQRNIAKFHFTAAQLHEIACPGKVITWNIAET